MNTINDTGSKINNFSTLEEIEQQNRNLFVQHYAKINRLAHQIRSNLNILRFREQILDCLESLPKDATVLEAGCGCGYVLMMIRSLRPDLKITGSDAFPTDTWNMLKEKGLKVIKDDTTHSKFAENCFDAVISFGVMEHTDADQLFLKEIHRILKPGGMNFIFNLPNKFAVNDFVARTLKIGGHKVRYNKAKIKKMFKEAGFGLLELKREYLIPAQVSRISTKTSSWFNKRYKAIDYVDRMLMKTPLNMFAQVYRIKAVAVK